MQLMCALCTGTMFVSEDSGQLYLHQLCLSPKKSFRRIMKIPSPEPDLGKDHSMLRHDISAEWAPDDNAVALMFTIEHASDPRTNAAGFLQVLSSCDVMSVSCVCLNNSNPCFAAV